MTIADLRAQGRLDAVPADVEEARDALAHAERHLASARRVVDDDPAGAYQLLYDAARKAAASHMLANGLRARNVAGAHAAVVVYAEEALAGSADERALARFDEMRRARNRSEYGSLTLGRAQIAADLEHAAEIVRAVRAALADE